MFSLRKHKNKGQERPKSNFECKSVKGLTYTVTESNDVKCCICDNTDKQHSLNSCKQVRAMPVKERWDKLKEKKICCGCQIPLHEVKHLKGQCHIKCNKCGKGHHELFHDENYGNPNKKRA